MYVQCPQCHQQNYATVTQCTFCGSPLNAAPAAQGFVQTGAPGFAPGATGPGGGSATGGTSSQPEIGQLIDRKYRVERVLGEGGMGVVYLAYDVNVEQRVVIKSIRPEFANRGDFRERTLAEGRALAKIDHPNVVRFNSVINQPETNELYLVMQYIEGESLDRTLEKANAAGQKLPLSEVIRNLKMTLDGVASAHREGLIHRDLKPANIIVRAKDKVAKVMDFGIAKAEGATKGPTQAGGIVGSLYYMAPEQIKGARDLDKRLDVYALGIVLYELTTGFVPFDGDTEYDIMTKHMTLPVPSVLGLRPDAPAWIDEIIAKATQKDRNYRFQSCEEMRAALDAFDGGALVPRSHTQLENPAAGPVHSGSGTAMMPAPTFPTEGVTPGRTTGAGQRRASSNVPIIAGAVAAVLLIGGGVGIYVATRPDDSPTSGKHRKQKHAQEDPVASADPSENPQPEKSTKTKVKPKDPLEELAGNWVTDTTDRHLRAVFQDGELKFRVANASEWGGAYAEDEVRFALTSDAGGTLLVEDRFRPPPPKGKQYSRDGLGGCMAPTKEVKGKALTAAAKGSDELEINMVLANMPMRFDPGDDKVIASCLPATLNGTVKVVIRRQK